MITEKIGILGGGQLGKMICQAGSKMNLDITCLDPTIGAPASLVCPNIVHGSFNDYEETVEFGKAFDVISIEIENVNTDALETLEQMGRKVFPQSSVIKLIKDKGLQKQFYKEHAITTSNFKLYESADQIKHDLQNDQCSFPFVQKLRTGGYDGKGVQIIKDESDLDNLFDHPSVVEDLVDIQKELSVIVARNADGDIQTYPVVDMEFNDVANLVEFLFVPSSVSTTIQEEAKQLAITIAEKLEIVGLLAVELFLDKHGNILVNEVAPRTHNSGHHSIEACVTSQFEQQLRAILNLPLGSTKLVHPSAVMINLLGSPGHTGIAKYEGIEKCLGQENVYIHIYGKEQTKPFRKMGHVTVTGKDLETAVQKARFVQNNLKVIS